MQVMYTKRLISSINNDRDVNSSQSKRFRSSARVQQDENVPDCINNSSDSNTVRNKKKVINGLSENNSRKKSNDENCDNNNGQITACTPSESSISFSSSSPTSHNKENHRKSNFSLHSQGNGPRVTRSVNDISNV
ncbi:unnamed protein product [Rotaria magnacalcarata]|uniref:Uncharacterized protein n=1 Tax=Rotaria magnacalcarata TaxID=392030 RepID=A0A816SG98_9BILA|nr:unnamed protein product [Rotaria magnacalcarata]CAF4266547.1 unnamed protein product [Rotaria magnacalcarata]